MRTIKSLLAALAVTAAAAGGAHAQSTGAAQTQGQAEQPKAEQTQQADRYGTQKVVYHVNSDGGPEGKGYKGAMNNVQNHINAVGEDKIEVVVVMHGDGLGLLSSAKADDRLQTVIGGLKSQGVKFRVCNNTLVGRNISWENDLYDVWQEDIVPSGVAELSYLQQQGYTYVKP